MKHPKRLLSLLLAALLLLSAVPVAVFAEDAPEGIEEILEATDSNVSIREDVSGYPILNMAGAWHPLYKNEGPDETVAFNPDRALSVDALMPVVNKMLDSAKKLEWDRFADHLIEFFWNGFGAIQCDENGNPIDDTISCDRPNQWEDTDGDGEIEYSFDWRLDAWKNAEKLHDWMAEREAQYGKFNIFGMSGSGQIILAYLKRYGTEYLASIAFTMSMHAGTSLFGGIATRKLLKIDADALGNTSKMDFLGLAGTIGPLQGVLKGLHEAGLLDVVLKFLSLATDKMMQKVYDEAITPLWFQIPQFWSFVPTSQYEEAKKLLFNKPGDAEKYAGLIERIDRYRYQVLGNQEALLKDAASKIKVAVRAGYGFPLIGFAQGTYVQSDEFVDTQYASFGATCAPLDKPFGKNYVQKVHSLNNYISPDRMIDASTCVLPDYTFFAQNFFHYTEHSYGGWYEWFLSTQNGYSIHDDPRFPQYVRCVEQKKNKGVFEPLVAEPESFGTMLLNALYTILKAWRFILLLPLFWIK